MPLSTLDRVFLDRTYDLARRAAGNTSPNPLVGAVIVRDASVVGEGYHHRAGTNHAEVNALSAAGDAAMGATAYVSLEPCNHVGRTPPCARALVEGGIARVVVGAGDPNPKNDGRGIEYLRANGVAVELADDAVARALIEPFAAAIVRDRPYVALKMAMSLDGYVTSRAGVQEWITGEPERLYVRDLRIAHDAVMVGAGTVRVDDPQLTVRPPHHRVYPYARIVLCETDNIPDGSRVLDAVDDYRPTIVVAPAGIRDAMEAVAKRAEVIFVGRPGTIRLNVLEAMGAIYGAGIRSVLCEGGPTLAARLLASDVVDRVYWAIAPRFLRTDEAISVLAGADVASLRKRVAVDAVERVGCDVVVTGMLVPEDAHV